MLYLYLFTFLYLQIIAEQGPAPTLEEVEVQLEDQGAAEADDLDLDQQPLRPWEALAPAEPPLMTVTNVEVLEPAQRADLPLRFAITSARFVFFRFRDGNMSWSSSPRRYPTIAPGSAISLALLLARPHPAPARGSPIISKSALPRYVSLNFRLHLRALASGSPLT